MARQSKIQEALAQIEESYPPKRAPTLGDLSVGARDLTGRQSYPKKATPKGKALWDELRKINEEQKLQQEFWKEEPQLLQLLESLEGVDQIPTERDPEFMKRQRLERLRDFLDVETGE